MLDMMTILAYRILVLVLALLLLAAPLLIHHNAEAVTQATMRETATELTMSSSLECQATTATPAQLRTVAMLSVAMICTTQLLVRILRHTPTIAEGGLRVQRVSQYMTTMLRYRYILISGHDCIGVNQLPCVQSSSMVSISGSGQLGMYMTVPFCFAVFSWLRTAFQWCGYHSTLFYIPQSVLSLPNSIILCDALNSAEGSGMHMLFSLLQ